MGTKQAGEFFGWGKDGKVTNTAKLTREQLEKAGWTKETLDSVAEGYEQTAKHFPKNPSAAARGKQLRDLSSLFDQAGPNQSAAATGNSTKGATDSATTKEKE